MTQPAEDIVVSCSGKFHAFALAEQLEKRNRLNTLFTSYAYQKDVLFRKLAKRVDLENINPNKIKTSIHLAFPMKLWPHKAYEWNSYYDLWVAKKLDKVKNAGTFIGWSGMSLESIRKAKSMGMTTIVERGSSHIRFQDRILTEEFKKFNLDFPIDPRVIEKECLEYDEADYISIPSQYVRQTFIDEGISSEKLLVNGYGVSSLFQKQRSVSPKTFTVLYVGKLSIQKGLIYLFQALGKLIDKGLNIQAIFIGTIDDNFKDTVEQYKRPEFKFLGQIPQHELPKHFQQISVAVQPSLQEGLSMVIPQLMSSGIPVIATVNTGGEDLITNDVNGYIVPIRDPDAIADKIEHLYMHPDVLEKVKIQLDQYVQSLSWDDYGDRYMANLQTVWNN